MIGNTDVRKILQKCKKGKAQMNMMTTKSQENATKNSRKSNVRISNVEYELHDSRPKTQMLLF